MPFKKFVVLFLRNIFWEKVLENENFNLLFWRKKMSITCQIPTQKKTENLGSM